MDTQEYSISEDQSFEVHSEIVCGHIKETTDGYEITLQSGRAGTYGDGAEDFNTFSEDFPVKEASVRYTHREISDFDTFTLVKGRNLLLDINDRANVMVALDFSKKLVSMLAKVTNMAKALGNLEPVYVYCRFWWDSNSAHVLHSLSDSPRFGPRHPKAKWTFQTSVAYGEAKSVTSARNWFSGVSWDDSGLKDIFDQQVPVPEELRKNINLDEERLGNIIPALNDELNWPFSKIADWLETLDIDINVASRKG